MPVTEKKVTKKKVTKKKGAKRATKKATKKKVAKKKGTGRSRRAAGSPGVWCFAKITNKAGKKLFPRLSGTGVLDKAAAKRLGVKQEQTTWWEVEASSQKEATAAVRKGSGKKVTRRAGKGS